MPAAVTFTTVDDGSGDPAPVHVGLTSSLTFTVTNTTVYTSFGYVALIFKNAYSAGVIGGNNAVGSLPTVGQPITLTYTTPSSVTVSNFVTLNGGSVEQGANDITPRDFYLLFQSSGPIPDGGFQVGGTFTFSAGSMVSGSYVLPDLSPDQAFVSDLNAVAISAPVSIPESSSLLLGGLGLVALMRRRR